MSANGRMAIKNSIIHEISNSLRQQIYTMTTNTIESSSYIFSVGEGT